MTEIQRLEDSTIDTLRSGLHVSSIHSIVEELVFNSLDAVSSCIKVNIHFQKDFFEVQVIDDGDGIALSHLQHICGQRYFTSKQFAADSYGFKGEALASISRMADVDILTKTVDSSICYRRNLKSNVVTVGTNQLSFGFNKGTIITVKNIFANFPVRLLSVKIHHEITKIKEFLQAMAIYHYHIGWSLYDVNARKFLIKYPPQSSVASRFLQIHSAGQFINMTEISISRRDMKLEGLISLLDGSCCHWTKEVQYLFVNNRWTKGSDLISNLINKFFNQTLSYRKAKSGGPAAKHHDPSGPQTALYPFFILHFTCPETDFDILTEMDKSQAVFKNSLVVESFVEALFANISTLVTDSNDSDKNINLPRRVDAGIDSTNYSEDTLPFNVDHTNQSEPLTASIVTSTTACTNYLDLYKYSLPYEETTTGLTVSTGISNNRESPWLKYFNSAFFGHGNDFVTLDRSHQSKSISDDRSEKIHDAGIDITSVYDYGVSQLSSVAVKRSRDMEYYFDYVLQDCDDPTIPSHEIYGIKSPSYTPARVGNVLPAHYFQIGAGRTEMQSLLQDNTVNIVEDQHKSRGNTVHLDNDDPFSNHNNLDDERYPSLSPSPDNFADAINNCFENNVSTADPVLHLNPPNPNPVAYKANFETMKNDYDNMASPVVEILHQRRLRHLNSARNFQKYQSESIKLTKALVQGASIIGQFDNKFIAITTSNGLLALVDQHAADERVKFESTSLKYLPCSFQLHEMSSSIVINIGKISSSDCFVLENRKSCFLRWGFGYSVTIHEDVDHDSDNDNASVVVTKSPIVENEYFTAEDFLEFVHYVGQNMDLPDSLLPPPAFHRIIASKSCKSAIKFGQPLSLSECEALTTKLFVADIPFQCAHGRPSVAPIFRYQCDYLNQNWSSFAVKIASGNAAYKNSNRCSQKLNIKCLNTSNLFL